MVRRRDRDGVDVLAVDDLAKVPVRVELQGPLGGLGLFGRPGGGLGRAEAERLLRDLPPPFTNRSFSFWSTSTSQSHSPTSRTPFILLQASVWLLPRPFRPIVAIRMSSFAPTTAAQDLAVHEGTLTAAAATSEPFSMLRRESGLLIVRDPVR